MDDLSQFIIAELARHGYAAQGSATGSWIKSRCVNPEHRDSTPSLSINRYTGGFRCFGCGIKGSSWNDLRQWIQVTELQQGDKRLPDPFRILREQHEALRKRDNTKFALPWDLEPWEGSWKLPHTRYRIRPALLKRLGATRWYDSRNECYRILFPCRQFGELVGWTARRLDDEEWEGASPPKKWLNCPGMMTRNVLFPLDAVARKSPKTVVLVEGPGDALRLLNERVSALAIMGTTNWDPESGVVQILHTGAKKVVLALDEDPAGELARKIMERDLKRSKIPLVHFHCPDKPGRNDPGSMSKSACVRLENLLS